MADYSFQEQALGLITLYFLLDPINNEEDARTLEDYVDNLPDGAKDSIIVMYATFIKSSFDSLEDWQERAVAATNVYESDEWKETYG